MIRKIVNIDEEKCNGCGLCAKACHEGAIEILNGKASLVSDEYCDGLGDCLPKCPEGAINIIERESKEYDEKAVNKKAENVRNTNNMVNHPFVCPGTADRMIKRETNPIENPKDESEILFENYKSELRQWPVQLNLLNTKAPYLNGADILVAADCTAYAYAGFHKDFIKERITLIGCPKLDDIKYYTEKLTEIFKYNNIKSITAVRMEVPCCGGLFQAVKRAMLEAQEIVPYREVVIGIDGQIK